MKRGWDDDIYHCVVIKWYKTNRSSAVRHRATADKKTEPEASVTLRHKRKVEVAVVTLSEDVSATGKALSQWQHDFTLSFISEVLNVPAARLTLICTVLFHSIFILCSIFLPMCRLFRCQNTSVLHACGDIILSQCHMFSEYKNLKNGNFIPAPQGPLKLSIISLIFAASCCLN